MFRFLGVCLLIAVVVPHAAQAATLFLDPQETSLLRGETMIMSLRLDVDEETDECVNLVDATITYPDAINAVDTSVGDSILQMWIERPTIDAANNRITLAGGIPNGYCGRIPGDPALTNVIAEVVFRYTEAPLASGSSTVAVALAPQTTAYLNDGAGTVAPLQLFGADVTLLADATTTASDPWTEAVTADDIPPRPFSIALERDESMFAGNYYIVFSTTDKETGIAQYEVMEEPLSEQSLFQFGGVNAPWQEARSPYELQDQTLNSTIRVRATDKAGNEYIATLVPDPSLRTTVWTIWHWIALVAGLVLLGATAFVGWRLARRRQPSAVSVSEVSDYKHDPYDVHDDTT